VATYRRSYGPLDYPRFRDFPLAHFRDRSGFPLVSAPVRNFPLGALRGPAASGAEGQWFESTRAYQIPRKSRGFLGLRIPPASRSGCNVAVSRGRVGVSAGFRDFPLAQALAHDLWRFEADAPSSCAGRARARRPGTGWDGTRATTRRHAHGGQVHDPKLRWQIERLGRVAFAARPNRSSGREHSRGHSPGGRMPVCD
jgi:hypothetical protein